MRAETFSIRSCHGGKSTVEKAAQGILSPAAFSCIGCLPPSHWVCLSAVRLRCLKGLLEFCLGTVAARSRIPSFSVYCLSY